MKVIDSNTQYAVEMYVTDVEKRQTACWCPLFNKQLVLIGNGARQHIECYSQGLVPMRRLWAKLFENGSSTDPRDISLYLTNKNIKRHQGDPLVEKYYRLSTNNQEFHQLLLKIDQSHRSDFIQMFKQMSTDEKKLFTNQPPDLIACMVKYRS
jgi:hypothetical protein